MAGAPLARAVTGEAHIANPDRGNDFHVHVQEPAQLFASLCREASRNGIIFSITAYDVDADHDAADRAAGRKITCPVMVLWA
jgi:hypothetical protein